jgi:hypothetical protein
MPPASLSVLRTTLFYGFGSVAFGVKDNGVAFLLLLYDNPVLGLPERWGCVGIMISLIVAVVLDPVGLTPGEAVARGAGDCGVAITAPPLYSA